MANRIADHTIAAKKTINPSTPTDGDADGLRVLGVDPGLDRTGYAVIDTARSRVCDAGLIRSASNQPLGGRLCEIDAGLQEVLDEHRVDLVAVEDLFSHYRHPRTAILMGHARGVILLAAARRGIEIVSLPATKVKKIMTGNGQASKIQMQRAIMAAMRLSTLPKPSDVADALAIAVCASLEHRDGANRSTDKRRNM